MLLRKKKTLIVWIPLASLLLLGLITALSHFPRMLEARLIATQSDTGIPGISKWYEGTITNRGLWPVAVTRCDAMDDGSGKETMVAYAVERWDQKTLHWVPVVVFDSRIFCKPYPLGIVSANLKRSWLWPGQSLSTGPELTGARLHKGDRARYAIFTGDAGDYPHSLVTNEVLIDEQVANPEIPYRVRH